MRRGLRPAPRAGFTLIELLTVIAILALLAALVAAGINRVRSGAQGNVSNQTLTKLQKAIENQWKATCDNARDDKRAFMKNNGHQPFADVVAICDGDADRAESLWMYLKLRQAMPQTFAEARQTPPFTISVSGNGRTVTLPPSSAFKSIGGSVTGSAANESAALLYMILDQGARGTSFSISDAMQGAQTSIDFGSGLVLPAFKDGFGTPIGFVRFYQNAEMDSPPYVRSGLNIATGGIADPLDPVGRLKLWKVPGTNTPSPTKALAETQVGVLFDGRNRIATAVSAGADKAFDLSGNTDDAFGYRVLRQGAKGD